MISWSFHPDAEAELREATHFYDLRAGGLGDQFAAEVRRTIELVRRFPEVGTSVGRRARRVLVDRFPFAVVYLVSSDMVIVIAVAHLSRRPRYWSQRIH